MPSPNKPESQLTIRVTFVCRVSGSFTSRVGQCHLMTGQRNGKKLSTISQASDCFGITNMSKHRNCSRPVSCITQTNRDMIQTRSERRERNSLISRDSQRNCSPGMNGERPWGTATNDVATWLESPEGEKWSQARHSRISALVTIKQDTLIKGKPAYYLSAVWEA